MQVLRDSNTEVVKKAGLTLAEQFEELGRERGQQKGSIAAKHAIVRQMLKSGLTAKKINELTNISLTEINQAAAAPVS